jgi:hypothetical protein
MTALPKLGTLTRDHVITLGDDLVVTFQLVPIPGSEYTKILDAHRSEDGKAAHEDVAVDILAAGISNVYSSVESTPAPFEAADANELWTEWPEWARWQVYLAVVAYSTQGPGANPFGKSPEKENGDS